jgi:hypothetical protein
MKSHPLMIMGVLAALGYSADKPEPQQLPLAMHSEMKEKPVLRVGQREGDILGSDDRALQAAVDYIAALGGGTVEIGEGVYSMRDSLHLRSHVTVRGEGEKTVLRKAPSVLSRLVLDGDFGEEQVTVENSEGFRVGDGVAIWDSKTNNNYTTVARITGKDGNTFSISRPLNGDFLVDDKAQAATVFPVVSGYDIEGAHIENLAVDGAREKNALLDGWDGGIFLYRAFGTVIRNCYVRNYNGDGISFQASNDVEVIGCVSENNAGLGVHPGTGSDRPVVRDCTIRNNGSDGLYLCWRVRHGIFESNQSLNNGRNGISIGHKDSDNLFLKNVVRGNGKDGIRFRNDPEAMAGHRNRIEENRIEDNGRTVEGAGIMIDGANHDILIRHNVIRDTRPAGSRSQHTAIYLGERAGEVRIEDNEIVADTAVKDVRTSATAKSSSTLR